MAKFDQFPAHIRAFVRHEAELFAKSLGGSGDLILAALRFHLIAEHFLERLILVELPRGDRIIEKGGLSFQQKLHLVDSLALLDDSIVQSLRHLNSLRNKCAHERDKTIVGSDIDLIGRPLGAAYTALRREHAKDITQLTFWTFAEVYDDLLVKVTLLEFAAGDAHPAMGTQPKPAPAPVSPESR